MFKNTISKKRKNEIKYQIKGLINDIESHRNNYHKVCNNKEFILRSLLNETVTNVNDIGMVEFDAYVDSLKRIINRLNRTEERFGNAKEEQYYNKQLKKILYNEANESNYLLNQYNTIKDVFPFFDDSKILFDYIAREIKRKKTINDLINNGIKKK